MDAIIEITGVYLVCCWSKASSVCLILSDDRSNNHRRLVSSSDSQRK